MNTLLATLMPIVLLVGPPQADREADVSVKLLNITKPAGSPSTQAEAGLAIEMELTGEPVRWATAYGNVRIKTAKDEHGRPLKLLDGWFLNTEGLEELTVELSAGRDVKIGPVSIFVSVNREAMHPDENPAPADRMKVELKLEIPPPSATKLAIVEGTLQLRTRPAELLIDCIEQKMARPLDIGSLNAAGLKVLIIERTETSITWVFTGDENQLMEAGLLDAEGKKISYLFTRISAGGKTTCTLQAKKPLPDDVRLRLAVRCVPETVEVPFKFEQVKLP